ncbi:flagellar hook-basal body complex protein FliE [Rhodobacteraceae bacterium]|nr:flagellar hook-basal body complex protein FliE [Paracoccaceae bacterium]
MKITASNTQLIQQKMNNISQATDQNALLQKKSIPSFSERLGEGLGQVAQTQNTANQLAKNFELGVENDLARVMVGQQVSSLAFQLTLNVRNKALSAYKDIMNMPV